MFCRPLPTVNIATRAGSIDWIRVGFVQPLEHPHRPHRPVHCECSKCKRMAKGALVFTHHAPCKCHKEPCKLEEAEAPCACAECEKHEHRHGHGYGHADGVFASQRRLPLFGRLVDYGRSLWEYHAYDSLDDVRVPVGVPRSKNELYDGDIVRLQGDYREYQVFLTELDDYYNFGQQGGAAYRFPVLY